MKRSKNQLFWVRTALPLGVLAFSLLLLVTSCSVDESTPAPPSKNATLRIVLADANVSSGGTLRYNMTITNAGEEKNYDVAAEHRIYSTTLGRSIKTEGEILKLETWIYKDKALVLPSDAPAGQYQLIVSIAYGTNQTQEAGGFFELAPAATEVSPQGPAALPSASPSDGSSSTAAPSGSSSGLTGRATAPVEQPAQPPEEVIVEHKERSFVPEKLTIKPRTVVRWINKDKTSTLVEGPGFHSNPLGVNGEFKHTFLKPGIFEYYSQLTKASGTITVEDPDHPLQFKRDPMSFKGGLNS